MKKSIFVLLASFCIALFFAMNVSINLSKDQSKSGLALQNIEALARGETPGGGSSKDAYASSYHDENGWHVYEKATSPCWCIGYAKRKPVGRSICTCTN